MNDDPPRPLTIDEHIRAVFDTAYDGCDIAVLEANPRAYGLEWVRVGFFAGMSVGQKMGIESAEIAMRTAVDQAFKYGQASAFTQAAFIASHCEIFNLDNPRDDIVKAIEKAMTPKKTNGAPN